MGTKAKRIQTYNWFNKVNLEISVGMVPVNLLNESPLYLKNNGFLKQTSLPIREYLQIS